MTSYEGVLGAILADFDVDLQLKLALVVFMRTVFGGVLCCCSSSRRLTADAIRAGVLRSWRVGVLIGCGGEDGGDCAVSGDTNTSLALSCGLFVELISVCASGVSMVCASSRIVSRDDFGGEGIFGVVSVVEPLERFLLGGEETSTATDNRRMLFGGVRSKFGVGMKSFSGLAFSLILRLIVVMVCTDRGGERKRGVFSEETFEVGVSLTLLREPMVRRRVDLGGDVSISGVEKEPKESLRIAGQAATGVFTDASPAKESDCFGYAGAISSLTGTVSSTSGLLLIMMRSAASFSPTRGDAAVFSTSFCCRVSLFPGPGAATRFL